MLNISMTAAEEHFCFCDHFFPFEKKKSEPTFFFLLFGSSGMVIPDFI